MHPDLVKKLITEFQDELNTESHSRAQQANLTRKELAVVERRHDGLTARRSRKASAQLIYRTSLSGGGRTY